MKPASVEAAYKLGYLEGREGPALPLNSWPDEAAFDKPDALLQAWMRGHRIGEGDRHEPAPMWTHPETEFHSDAAPGL